MLIQCPRCQEVTGCVDEKTNKTEKCSKCPEAEYCQARFDTSGETITSICSQCILTLGNNMLKKHIKKSY